MSESDSTRAQQASSLRDRVASVFRASPAQRSSPSPPPIGVSRQGQGLDAGSPSRGEITPRTRLLESYETCEPVCGSRPCNHGTFSPRPGSASQETSNSLVQKNGTRAFPDSPRGGSSIHTSDRDDAVPSPLGLPPGATTKQLAKRHGVNRRNMYISYYVPFFNWITQYRWSFLQGDLISAITVASIYIPMSLSLASNVAHSPPMNGLYSFVFNPLVYAVLGSSPLMVVGPEAAGSLLVGTVIRGAIKSGEAMEDDPVMISQIVGVVTGLSGAMILIGGITRLGFLDNILSRPFLRGFISAIGFMIFVDQLIPQLGLTSLAKQSGSANGSSVEKLGFLLRNITSAHSLTSAVAFGSFAAIMIFRILKRRLEPRFPSVVFFPDRFLVVFLSAVLAWKLQWNKRGLDVLGSLKEEGNPSFAFQWPFKMSHLRHLPSAMSTSFIVALLGFFESSIAAKGLGDANNDGIKGISLSANRELIALGASNVIGGCFMALPAFGGYGRSKLNAATGAKSPMSGVFLGLITLVCILYLLPYFYYLPMAVLSSMISVVAISLIEEAPDDLRFFFRLRGWSELSLIFIIFFSTIFYSLYLGIALGMGLSILQIIRHATKPRIQILGKIPGTHDRFENAENVQPEKVEFIDGCLIVKIPEPLTFANTGDLKNRLRRLEFYGTTAAHPALPRVRAPEHNRNMIFDIHGVTSIDGSGIQVLSEIVQGYVDQGVRVFFCRYPQPGTEIYRMMEKSGIVDAVGGVTHFVRSVDEALRLTEMAELGHP
ncbi:sulfate transporter [Blastomyces gilchristii SLH14081]|uniref:Sulfate transporter n=1 Tax=Blastomyces gilchristii (strain SLH14081) TaxID=559298 RepID=A0A179URU8_BLAGS|nr:sulfate transporter [Blastomyces gilchristii SLH14081]OAT10816.1 sulfate transporter [Blastomyces gilchristii SLH14081]